MTPSATLDMLWFPIRDEVIEKLKEEGVTFDLPEVIHPSAVDLADQIDGLRFPAEGGGLTLKEACFQILGPDTELILPMPGTPDLVAPSTVSGEEVARTAPEFTTSASGAPSAEAITENFPSPTPAEEAAKGSDPPAQT